MYSLNFFPNHCYVKDRVTHRILMGGKLKHGFYVFDPPKFLPCSTSSLQATSKVAYLSTKNLYYNVNDSPVSSDSSLSLRSSSIFTLWHNRLGHPATNVVKSIIRNCNIPCITIIEALFCFICCLRKIQKFPCPSSL